MERQRAVKSEKHINREKWLSRVIATPAVIAAVLGALDLLSGNVDFGLIEAGVAAVFGIPAIKIHNSAKREAQHKKYIELIRREKKK
jgi:hypothetical protein